MQETSGPVPPDAIPAPGAAGSGAVEEATAIWRALAALGVREAVLAPGSRSAPLVHALADDRVASGIRAHVRIDERAAAFTALGISRHDGRHPAAVLTTSGTATAHLLAAVMEAHHSQVPLLVITADRPAELRGTGANQTTRQPGLFGEFVRYQADLPAPTATGATAAELRTAVTTAARAVAAANGEHPGPVHLNLAFRDPLVPTPAEPGTAEQAPGRIVLTHRPRHSDPAPHPVPISDATVIVAGDGAGRAAADLAETHALPLLAEPSSGARDSEQLVPGYPALLTHIMADRDHALRPDRAIVLGRPTLSRAVISALLGADDLDVIVVDPAPEWTDAARRARLVVPAATAAPPRPEVRDRRRERTRAWQQAAAEATAGLPATWQQQAALAVWEATGADDVLVLGSSSLVRDLEQHAGRTAGRVIANRGLAGIDGTISTAGGIDLARRAPDTDVAAGGRVRLLVGDLTALHDVTGLIIGPEERRPQLDVVVVDDDGGRIFGGLEHAAAPPGVLRRFFTTPHGVDIAAAAGGLGARAAHVGLDDLRTALAHPPHGIRMLIVQEGSSSRPTDSGAEVLE